jgi:hypothetical protein
VNSPQWIWAPDTKLWLMAPPDSLRAARNDATSTVLQELEQSELPSGINNFRLRANDHIAVIVFSDGKDSYFDLILDFLTAGIENRRDDELLSLELTEGREVRDAVRRLEKRLSDSVPMESIDIRGWERNQADYEPERFTHEGMWRAMDSEAVRLHEKSDAVLRVASEDCSAFMGWLENPKEYLDYEYELGRDLTTRIEGRRFIQLCTFQVPTIERLGERIGGAKAALLDLALSHNRLLVIEDDVIQSGRPALWRVLKYATPPSMSALGKWLKVFRQALSAT